MSDVKVGAEVVNQANDTGIFNTEPAVAKAAVVGLVTSVLVALGAFGLVTEEQRDIIIEQVGNLTFGLFVLLPVIVTLVTGLWTRLSTFSPRSAAQVAVKNAAAPVGAPPTLPS